MILFKLKEGSIIGQSRNLIKFSHDPIISFNGKEAFVFSKKLNMSFKYGGPISINVGDKYIIQCKKEKLTSEVFYREYILTEISKYTCDEEIVIYGENSGITSDFELSSIESIEIIDDPIPVIYENDDEELPF